MKKVCFVISPMGDDYSETRKRADFVLETYIRPACNETGYEGIRSDHQISHDIVNGITTALQNSPMAIAYIGSPQHGDSDPSGAPYWNANVMIELGYRMSARLPIVYVCERDEHGAEPNLPLSMRTLDVVFLPHLPRPAPEDPWKDPHPATTIAKIRGRIEFEGSRRRPLDSLHAFAWINAASRDTRTPENLLYTAASYTAEDLFGVDGRLVGRNMTEFLEAVASRMHPVQWEMFKQDQEGARAQLSGRMQGSTDKPSIARVPIVFEKHRPELNNRAFLPIIVQDFRPDLDGDNSWYNLRVLYLNVTTATREATNAQGEKYYVCDLDPTSHCQLRPLPPVLRPIHVFCSYNHADHDAVGKIYEDLIARLRPSVECWLDCLDMDPGTTWTQKLDEALNSSEACFVFVGGAVSNGQFYEVMNYVVRRDISEGGKFPIIPVLLDGVNEIPPQLSALKAKQWVHASDLNQDTLRRIFVGVFRDRCPDAWSGKPEKEARPAGAVSP
jgi:hypothetical protein